MLAGTALGRVFLTGCGAGRSWKSRCQLETSILVLEAQHKDSVAGPDVEQGLWSHSTLLMSLELAQKPPCGLRLADGDRSL